MYDNDFDDYHPKKESKVIPLHSSQIQERLRQQKAKEEAALVKKMKVDLDVVAEELKRIREKFLGL